MRRTLITRRHIFVVEYTCRPKSENLEDSRCHGWIRYRSAFSDVQMEKPYKKIEQIPGLIRSMLEELGQGDEGDHKNTDDMRSVDKHDYEK